MQAILKAAQHATERLAVKSALNPLLWLCTITTTILLATALLFDRSDTLRAFCGILVYVALSPVVLSVLAGLYLVLFRPDKLQSEEYQLRQQALLLIQQSGATTQAISPADIAALIKSATPRRQIPSLSIPKPAPSEARRGECTSGIDRYARLNTTERSGATPPQRDHRERQN
jgi:hypothetical protein